MTERLRQLVAPAYLVLCLVLGGSVQAIWGNAVLQLLGLALIAWAALEPPRTAMARPGRQLVWLVGIAVAYAAIQLIPLPASLWSSLGPRAEMAEAYRLMGIALPALPLSIAPYDTLATLLTLIPPIALYVAVERLHAFRTAYLVAALAAGALASILLGVFQVASPDPVNSPFYLFRDVNLGVATGFFANANHLASLLLATLPFLAALVASARASDRGKAAAVTLAATALALVIGVGIVLSKSLAAILLAPAVIGASALIAFNAGSRVRRWAIIGAAVLLGAGTIGLNLTTIGATDPGGDPVQSRPAILGTTSAAAIAYMPFGSGLGTYRAAYDSFEDPNVVTPTRSRHAHNDYAEIALELGLPGIFLLLLFAYWWARGAVDSWRSPEPQSYVRAAAVASAAILAHSLVDYPLRTAAVASVFALCLAFLADRVKGDPLEANALRPTRHLTLR